MNTRAAALLSRAGAGMSAPFRDWVTCQSADTGRKHNTSKTGAQGVRRRRMTPGTPERV